MSRDLENTAKSLVWEAVQYEHCSVEIDLDSLREDIDELAHSRAESVCIYTNDCEQIICDYESDPRADTDTADDCGKEYKPSEYRDAMCAYAFWIARSVIQAEASDCVDAIAEAIDDLTAELATLGIAADESLYRLSADCPHGWAAHDRENATGGCFWLSRQLDGLNAVALPCGGVWIGYTWEPK